MKETPESLLEQYWGHLEFRPSQKKIISEIRNGNDQLVVMPTGAGKSVCFQIPALLEPGICIVISPLIALIRDQVNRLKNMGIKAIGLTGSLSYSKLDVLLDNCIYGNIKFLYLSPERLQQNLIQERLKKMPVNGIAIDEAHCISIWGHDFRPAYRKCRMLRSIFPNIPITALTATATTQVCQDIIENLDLKKPLSVKTSFVRSNLLFEVRWNDNKLFELKRLLSKTETAIVYVGTRKETLVLSRFLKENHFEAMAFHGGMEESEKNKRLTVWKNNAGQIMVATSAFGMGIDKANVRKVIHLNLPDSLENYYQEAGRSGRDGKTARAIIITNKLDQKRLFDQYLGSLPDASFLKDFLRNLYNYFQIAWREHTDQIFKLSLPDFCAIYELPYRKSINALQILDRYQIISLSAARKKVSSIQINVSSKVVFEYIRSQKNSGRFLQTILRMYGGVFDLPTDIEPQKIARKLQLPLTEVQNQLKRLHHDHIIDYKTAGNETELSFLGSREDEITINTIKPEIDQHLRHKEEKIRAVLHYVNNNHTCRMLQLARYFGEDINQNCNCCDNCKKLDSKVKPKNGKVTNWVLGELQTGPKSSRDLSLFNKFSDDALLLNLQNLLKQGSIELDYMNRYQLKK